MATNSNTSTSSRNVRLLLAIFVLLTGALIAAYFFLRKDYAVLYQHLRPEEASAIVAELKQQGVDYQLADGGSRILVGTSDLDATRLSVAAADLPVKGLEGFELFNSSDMGLTEFTQKIKYQRALQGELARTIMMMQGVVEARVHISIPERSVFRGEQGRPKAAVTLITRPDEAESPARIEGVQQLVAAAIQDLSVSDTVVLNARGEVISRKTDQSGLTDDGATAKSAEILEVIRRVAPGQVFEVRAERAGPEAPPSAVAETSAQVMSGPAAWVITIASRSIPVDETQNRIVSELTAVGAIAKERGDTVAFEARLIAPNPTMPVPSSELRNASEPAETPVVPEPESASAANLELPAFMPVIAGILGALVAAVVLIALLTRRTSARLSVDDQRRFADRLRLGLEDVALEGSHDSR